VELPCSFPAIASSSNIEGRTMAKQYCIRYHKLTSATRSGTICCLLLGLSSTSCQAPSLLDKDIQGVTDPCSPLTNPIACENSQTGNRPAEWDLQRLDSLTCELDDPGGLPCDYSCINDSTQDCISGFTTDISANIGQRITLKIETLNPRTLNYKIDIYRLGYYGGNGARHVTTLAPSPDAPLVQPACAQGQNGLVDCGNWGTSATWDVPSSAISGVYIAKLTRLDAPSTPAPASHITFIIRDDTGVAGGHPSNILFQTSDTTWQAYNGCTFADDTHGPTRYGPCLYNGAQKVSYNRPFTTRIGWPFSWFRTAEYPMIRWLEQNGYDVSYAAGVDTDRSGQRLLNHKIFLSTGHDEYWSGQQRANVEAARSAGVHLAFFSGNEVYWKTRWEDDFRTLVTYKETQSDLADSVDPLNGVIRKPDPSGAWTGTWRDPSDSPPSDGGRPENALTGTLWLVSDAGHGDYSGFSALNIPKGYGAMRLWRHSAVSTPLSINSGSTISGGCNCILGNEWDADVDNGFRPAGLIHFSETASSPDRIAIDYGETLETQGLTLKHNLTLYKDPAHNSLVFGAGTVNWAWALDPEHDHTPAPVGSHPEPSIQQATVNILADMGAQPATLQSELHPETASADTLRPSSTINVPAGVEVGSTIQLGGGQSDSGGGVVGGVDISFDSGSTWHPTQISFGNDGLHPAWSYSWTPLRMNTVNIRTRAADDSGNVETPSSGLNVTVNPRQTHALLFYNRNTGQYATVALGNDGSFTNVSSGAGFAVWTTIVAGGDSGSIGNHGTFVLAYNSTSGSIAIGNLSHTGIYSDLSQEVYTALPTTASFPAAATSICTGYTNIIITQNNYVLFYNNANTNCEHSNYLVAKLLADGAHGGRLTPLYVGTFSSGWTHVVAASNDVILFYNRATGAAQTGIIDRNGGYTNLRTYPPYVLTPLWDKVVSGVNNELLFYNSSGQRVIARLEDDGTFTNLTLGTFSPGWDGIAGGIKNSVLLFYTAATGFTAIGRLDGNGGYSDVTQYSGLLSTNWTDIIAE
jgi:hypothetical protein